MIMTTRTIVTVIGTTMDMIVEMMVMATDEMEAGMVDTINIDDDKNKTERYRKLVRNIYLDLATQRGIPTQLADTQVHTIIVSDLLGLVYMYGIQFDSNYMC